MKFRTKMILAYATISLLVSLVLGMGIYQISLRYEMNSQKNNLVVSARSYVTQMDDRLGRMNAILYYILSDPNMLDSMTILGRASEGTLPYTFILDAQSTMSAGVSTEYIIRNSYRTVFFNQNGYLASSAVKYAGAELSGSANQRLIESFQVKDIDYLEPVIEGDGRSVIVGVHPDFWSAYDKVPVFSLMKAPRGYNLGFLEVESRLDSLAALETSDPQTGFAILINGDELLYSSELAGEEDEQVRETKTALYGKLAEGLSDSDTRIEGGMVYALSASDDFDLRVLTFKSADLISGARGRLFLTAFIAALAMFAVSLVIIIVWSSRLTRPIRQLQRIVEDTNIENLQDEQRVEQMERSGSQLDEFAELARSYQAMTGRLDEAVRSEKRAAMLQLQAQFDTLQTQVNPHFIYNVLNIISSRGVMADDEVICEMCGALGNMLRYSTNNKARYAKVEEELEYLKSYFYLLQCRYQERLSITVDMDEEILSQVIPKMTLQQIVENSIKHGFHDTDMRMEIALKGRKEAQGWYLRVRDNGSGAGVENLKTVRARLEEVRRMFAEHAVPTEAEIGGIGLTNTYSRCLLLFGADLVFDLENLPGGGFEVVVGERYNA